MSEEDTLSLSVMGKEVRKLFDKKTPKTAIKLRRGANGMMFPYVPIDYVVNELDKTFGIYWEFLVDDVRKTDKQIIVRGRLVVKSPNGFSVSRPGVGRASIKCYQGTTNPVDEGNDEKAATSDAIKKAASLFGIAADVYYKELEKYEDIPEEIDQMKEDKQRVMSKFFAVAAARGFDGEKAKARIKEVCGVAHMEDLRIDQLVAATASLEKYYEVVGPGDDPRKIDAALSLSFSPEAPPPDPEEKPIQYCRNDKKHGKEQILVPADALNKYFCCPDCEDQYWGKGKYGTSDRGKKFYEFLARGKQNAEKEAYDQISAL